LFFESLDNPDVDVSFEQLLAYREGQSSVQIRVIGGIEIPILVGVSRLTPGEAELAKDFKELFFQCSLVDSVGSAALPDDGGWNNQDEEFVQAWMIYKEEKSRAESHLIKSASER